MSLSESVARKLDFEPGDSIEEIVDRLGGSIETFDVTDDSHQLTDSIEIEDIGQFKIWIAQGLPYGRDRFTIAHELGHYFLHYPNVLKPMRAKRFGTDRVEREANWFAAAFLMPAKAFRSRYHDADGDLNKIVSIFRVSPFAAAVRAKALGIL